MMNICGSLPLLFAVLMWRYFSLRGWEVREAFLAGNIVSGVLVVLSVEFFSLFRWLDIFSLLGFWLLSLVMASAALSRMPGAFQWHAGRAKAKAADLFRETWFVAAPVLTLAGATWVVAILAAPNTWDSMTYHLPRVMHWAQDASLGYYPTSISRQNENPCGAEYLLLHFYLLSGNDRLFNLVQWGGLVVSGVACSLLAFYLGAGAIGQWLAALAAMSVPMVVLQSTSTQTDLVAAGWIMTAVVFLFRRERSVRTMDFLLIGMSAGLALLTKGTVVVFLPFFVVFLISCCKRSGFRAIGQMLIIVLSVMVLVFGWGFRYWQAGHQGVLVREAEGLFLSERTPLVLVSNLVKQAASECVVPARPVVEWCARGTMAIHQALGIGIDDVRTTGGSIAHMFLFRMALDEDYAGNLVHVLVFLGVAIAGVVLGGTAVRGYALCWFVTVLLFGVVFKWQPWINRLHVPLLIAAAPLAGIFLSRWRWLWALMVCVFIFVGITAVLFNNTRPLAGKSSIISVPREYQYYWKKPALVSPYFQAAKIIKDSGCSDIGLNAGGDSWEYPWWALLGKEVRIEHVDVSNASAALPYPRGSFEPCMIIDVVAQSSPSEAFFQGRKYRKIAQAQGLVLYGRNEKMVTADVNGKGAVP